MRLSHNLMPNGRAAIGGVVRAPRNDWAKSLEPAIRSACPLPITYDVDSTQPAGFSEFSYTEFLGGVYLNTQSVEINARLIESASNVAAVDDHIDRLRQTGDKYELESTAVSEWPKKVGFMVGHNIFDIVSSEILARTAFENRDFYLKPHPLTNAEYAGRIAHLIGWDRIIKTELSGVDFVRNCEDAYVTTATELCALAVANGKRVHNLSSFFNESSGAYYPINRLLFKAKAPRETLNNIIDCQFSGVLFPWMTDVPGRMQAYFQKALEAREMYRPVSTPTRLVKIPSQ